MKFWLCILAGLGWHLASATAADWPQWRGLHRDGISAEIIRSNWPAAGPVVAWRAAVGTGFSAVAIGQGRAITLGNTNGQDTIWCFEARTGRELWKHSYAAALDPQYYEGGPSATPTLAEGRVFTISKWGDVFCLDAATGNEVWRRDLRELKLKPNRWGFAGSPLVWEDLVILNAGAAGIALERATGRVAWSSATNATGYASPVLIRAHGEPVVLIFGAKQLIAVNPRTGHELWRFPWETRWDTNNVDPLDHPAGVFLSSFSRGCGLVSVSNGVPQLAYESHSLSNHLSASILKGDFVYAFNGEAHFKTDFRCVHLPTGEVKWAVKEPAFGSLIGVGEDVLILSEKGELCLAKVSPAGFTLLAQATVLSGVCWTPPAFADGLLYVRNAQGELRCIDLRPGTEPR